jgi:hypothetical protein
MNIGIQTQLDDIGLDVSASPSATAYVARLAELQNIRVLL